MPKHSVALTAPLLTSILVLAGCAAAPPAQEPEPVPLTPPETSELNIPEPTTADPCDCTAVAPEVAENYFDRGVRALAARDYARARVYFERHRESDTPEAQREADVGIAFVTLLDQSVSDQDAENGASGVDERAEVMILAMAAIEVLESQLDKINELNRALASDLEKREEALKRLRDLTLGQPEG